MKTSTTVMPVPTAKDLWDWWMKDIPTNLQSHDGIRAQLAAAAALVIFFESDGRSSEFFFLPEAVGDVLDRTCGYDGYIINKRGRYAYALDFSLESSNNPRGNKAGVEILVHLRRDWFEVLPCGRWVLNPRCLNSLVRAFVPALGAGPSPLIRDWEALRSRVLPS